MFYPNVIIVTNSEINYQYTVLIVSNLISTNCDPTSVYKTRLIDGVTLPGERKHRLRDI